MDPTQLGHDFGVVIAVAGFLALVYEVRQFRKSFENLSKKSDNHIDKISTSVENTVDSGHRLLETLNKKAEQLLSDANIQKWGEAFGKGIGKSFGEELVKFLRELRDDLFSKRR